MTDEQQLIKDMYEALEERDLQIEHLLGQVRRLTSLNEAQANELQRYLLDTPTEVADT